MPILQRFSGVIWWFGKGMYSWVEVSGREIISKYCLIKAFIYRGLEVEYFKSKYVIRTLVINILLQIFSQQFRGHASFSRLITIQINLVFKRKMLICTFAFISLLSLWQ